MVKYTIGDALTEGIALLYENKIQTAGLDARMLLCHVLGCDKLYLTVHRDECISEADYGLYREYILRRTKNEPVSYITGTKEFMSLEFKVNPNVLIPRPDTEILVETVIRETEHQKSPVIVDMCTGSGAIAVSLAKYIDGAIVTALDISSEALCIAKENALKNNVSVRFEKHDVLMPYKAQADVLVSNPPYIPTEDVYALDSNVSDYEPHLALDGGNDGLDFYRAITELSPNTLKKGGLLAFEVGFGQAEDVMRLMEPFFDGISAEKDLAGIDRVVYGYLR